MLRNDCDSGSSSKEKGFGEMHYELTTAIAVIIGRKQRLERVTVDGRQEKDATGMLLEWRNREGGRRRSRNLH